MTVAFAPQLSLRAVTTATTVGQNEFLAVDASSGAVAITGPAAGTSRRWGVKKTDASGSAVSISYTTSAGTVATIALTVQDDAKTFEAFGSGYVAVGTDRSRAADDDRYGRVSSSSASALYGFHGKLARASFARCNIVVAGDSIGEAQVAPSPAQGWRGLLESILRRRYGNGVNGPGWSPSFYWASDASGTTFPSEWTYTGSTAQATDGFGYRSMKLVYNASTPGKATITKTGTGASIFVQRAYLDVVSIKVDGTPIAGSPFTMDINKPLQRFDITGLTAGSHIYEVANAGASTNSGPDLIGAMFYNGDESSGIAVIDGSRSGAKMQYFAQLSGGNSGTDWTDVLSYLPTDLVILTCLMNDARTSTNGYSSAQYKTYAQQVITRIRAKTGATNMPILFMTPHKPTATQALVEPWANYTQALKDLVSTNANTAFFDMSAHLPANVLDGDAYSFSPDGTHPSAYGYGVLANLALAAITPGMAS